MPQPPAHRIPGVMYVRSVHPHKREHGGWFVYSSLLLLYSACGNAVYGILGLAHDYYFSGDTLLPGSVSIWGWFWIGFSLFQVIVAFMVLARHALGVVLGISIAGLNVLAQVGRIGTNPGWAIVVILLDLLVIYGLAAHGFEE